MSEPFQFGVTNLSPSGRRRSFARLEQGVNEFRILPPVHSLAQTGQYTKFYAFHGGFKSSQGYLKMFECIQRKDKSTKLVTERCPVCDWVEARIGQYNQLKAAIPTGQATEEQAKKFWNEQIFPYRVQKAFFLNAINTSNEFVILSIPYKAWQSLDYLLKQEKEQGNDPTGVNGAFINFTKIQPFKGSKDVSFQVQLSQYREGNTVKIKAHTLTPEVINQAATATADLGNLYRKLSYEDAMALVQAPAGQVGILVDRIFGLGEQTQQAQNSPLNTHIPNTNAVAVGRVEQRPDGNYNVVTPVNPYQAPAAPAPAQNVAPTTAAPVQPRPATTAAPVQNVPAGANFMGQTQVAEDLADLSDDEFTKQFLG